MTNQFGNYVIQRLFEHSDPTTRIKIYNKIKTFDYNELRKSQYGKKQLWVPVTITQIFFWTGKHVLSFIEKQMDDNLQRFWD